MQKLNLFRVASNFIWFDMRWMIMHVYDICITAVHSLVSQWLIDSNGRDQCAGNPFNMYNTQAHTAAQPDPNQQKKILLLLIFSSALDAIEQMMRQRLNTQFPSFDVQKTKKLLLKSDSFLFLYSCFMWFSLKEGGEKASKKTNKFLFFIF